MPQKEVANELMDAMTGLHHKLWYGSIGHGKRMVPVAGDTTRLPFANNLTALQKKLAWNMNFLAQSLPGVQHVRQLMGHCQFGTRVNYGDTLFMTIMPNPQHSALVLRLFRARKNDPFLKHPDVVDRVLQANAGTERPPLEAEGDCEGHSAVGLDSQRCPEHIDNLDPSCARCVAYESRRMSKRKLNEAAVEQP